MSVNLFWCNQCNVPLLKEKCEICNIKGFSTTTDFKPMFKREVKFFNEQLDIILPGKDWQSGMWRHRNYIIHNGEYLIKFNMDKTIENFGKPGLTKAFVTSKNRLNRPKVNREILYKANKSSMDKLEQEAIKFIEKTLLKYSDRFPYIAFSGGKDSVVVSHLVRKVLSGILHIFADNGNEYPDTYQFMKKFKRTDVNLFVQTTENNFLEMCKLLEPPNRFATWCCSMFKTNLMYEALLSIMARKALGFLGIRKAESPRRKERTRIDTNKKLRNSISAFPILEWRDIELWIYILCNNIPYNNCYKKGTTRAGCLACPHTSPFNEYILKYYYPEKMKKWFDLLFDFADKLDISNPKEYIIKGFWRHRCGSSLGNKKSLFQKKECFRDDSFYMYELNRNINADILYRFIPFGEYEQYPTTYDLAFLFKDKDGNPLFSFESKKNRIKVNILADKAKKRLIQRIERQLRKYQICLLCGACFGVCPNGAIQKIDGKFCVNEKLCNHCLECIKVKNLGATCAVLNCMYVKKFRWRDNKI